VGNNGNYWSATPHLGDPNNAYQLNFNSGNVNPQNNNNRANGQSVRCVAEFTTCMFLQILLITLIELGIPLAQSPKLTKHE